MPLGLMLAVVVWAVSACTAAQTQWAKPGAAVEQVLSEQTACQRWARREAAREAGTDANYDDPSRPPDAWGAQMSRYDQGRRVKALTARCMHGRGYSPGE